MTKWPMVPLGQVVQKSNDWIPIDPNGSYREVTVRLWGKGVALRKNVTGVEIAAGSRLRVHSDEFIISRIDARNGASGLIPEELEGAIVSSDFPVFTAKTDRLLPAFLGWYSQTKTFVNICAAASEGTTNRVRLKEERFLAQSIPLPPLPEQERLVEYLNTLSTRIREAKRLVQDTLNGFDELCRSILSESTFGNPSLTPMSELVSLRPPDVSIEADGVYQFAGVYCFGRGVFVGQNKSGMDFQYPRLTRLRKNNFVYPKLMAWEGALAVVPPECDGLVVSTEFPVFEIDQSKVLPEVLDVYFRTPSVWPALSGASTGTNVRRKRLNPADFLKYQIPLPSKESQQRLREIRSKLRGVTQGRVETIKELDAMLPAILHSVFHNGELGEAA